MDATNRISRRDLLIGAGATGAALAADSLLPASARASQQSADQVTLNFWTNHDATDVPLFQQVIRNFEAKYRNIKVNMTNYPAAGSNYDQTLIPTRAVSGSLGDVFYNRTFATADRASRSWTLDLTPFVKKEHFSLKDFWPAEVPQMMWKGKLYSLPYDFSDFGLFYNKTMFAQKGIKSPPVNGNWTWDELFRLAKEFVPTSGKQSTWGVDFVGTVSGGWPTPGFVLAWGGKWLSKDLHKFLVNTAEAAHMFQMFQDAVFKTKVAPRGATLPAGFDPWQSGKLAMAVNGSWATLQMRSYIGHRFDWDVVPLPKGPAGRRPISPAGGAWSIAASSKHPKEAWEFIKFLTSTQSAEILISKPVRSIPGRRSAVPMWVKTVKSAKLPPRHAGVFASEMAQAFNVPTVPYYNELTTITGNYVNAMLVTNKPVKDMLARWQHDGQAAIDKYHF